jgi:hypothetical protein
MTAIVLFVAAMAFFVVPVTWLIIRVHRADQQKIDRIYEDWEASGREEPWTWDVWSTGGGGGP